MSFILDALKKSESERQRQGSAEFAGVPTSTVRSGAPRWLWIIGLLLAINLAVLVGLWMRPDVRSTEPVALRSDAALPAAEVESLPAREADDDFMARIAVARQNPPAVQEAPAEQEAPAASAPVPAVVLPAVVPEPVAINTAGLPTFYQVITDGTLELPDLHLDIHVYSDAPDDRFVFINMSKQRESSTLSEGPVVEEITPDGVVLAYRGTRFLLPRD